MMIARRLVLGSLALGLVGLAVAGGTAAWLFAPRSAVGAGTADTGTPPVGWDALALPRIEGGTFEPGFFDGKAVLLVNTASFCGFTRQYEGLQALWEARRDDGLIVLGVPSNDFGNQEPGTEDEIQDFCETTFGIDFPMTTKQTVVGPSAHPLYRWAAEATGPSGVPRWNFHKILIDRDGRLAGWFGTGVKPDAPQLTQAIDQALAARAGS
jgi:glutathione peroxidase